MSWLPKIFTQICLKFNLKETGMSKRVVLFVITLTILNSCFHIHLNSWLYFPRSSVLYNQQSSSCREWQLYHQINVWTQNRYCISTLQFVKRGRNECYEMDRRKWSKIRNGRHLYGHLSKNIDYIIPKITDLIWCSHRDSNAELGIRNPLFYPVKLWEPIVFRKNSW